MGNSFRRRRQPRVRLAPAWRAVAFAACASSARKSAAESIHTSAQQQLACFCCRRHCFRRFISNRWWWYNRHRHCCRCSKTMSGHHCQRLPADGSTPRHVERPSRRSVARPTSYTGIYSDIEHFSFTLIHGRTGACARKRSRQARLLVSLFHTQLHIVHSAYGPQAVICIHSAPTPAMQQARRWADTADSHIRPPPQPPSSPRKNALITSLNCA